MPIFPGNGNSVQFIDLSVSELTHIFKLNEKPQFSVAERKEEREGGEKGRTLVIYPSVPLQQHYLLAIVFIACCPVGQGIPIAALTLLHTL